MTKTEMPGLRLDQLCAQLSDDAASRLVPTGAFKLVNALNPVLLEGDKRAQTLGHLVSLELAVDDPSRRAVLLDAIPDAKRNELQKRLRVPITTIRDTKRLKPPTRRSLLGFLGMSAVTEQREPPSENSLTVEAKRGLFAHQKRAAAEIERHLYSGTGRAIMHFPTGTGKTRTAMSIVVSHLRAPSAGVVLWLAATRELLEQAASEFEVAWQAAGDRPLECIRFWSHYSERIEQVKDGIIIAGLAKLQSYGRRRERLWQLGNHATMVVFDEAHQAVAPTYEDLVESIVTRNPRTALLGLSATPGRTWGEPEVDAAVAQMFHMNKITLDVGGGNPIRWLVSNGYLAETSFSLLNVRPGIQLTPDDIADVSRSLDVPEDLAIRLGDDSQRNLRVLQRLLDLTREHPRVLVFAASVRNAHLLAAVCRAIGIAADVIVGTTGLGDRTHIIARFRRQDGHHRVLINYGVLTTGFDAPGASAALIARPTKSLVLYSQMVGRVIRGPRAGGTKRCEIITVVDTSLPGFGDVAEAFVNWEDIWTR